MSQMQVANAVLALAAEGLAHVNRKNDVQHARIIELQSEVERLKADRLTFRTGYETASNRCVDLEAEVNRLRSIIKESI